MPLGIDATIYYAVEQQKGIATYTHELTEAQLHIDSPLQHAHPHGAAADADLQPRHRLDPCRRAPGPRRLPLLRRRRGRLWRAGLLQHARRLRSQRRRLQGRGRQERRAPAALQARLMTRLGVLGWPVAHSRSPAMHNAALAALGMSDWRYQRAARARRTCSRRRRARWADSGFVGANVTIPHKQAALALADEASAAARARSARPTR